MKSSLFLVSLLMGTYTYASPRDPYDQCTDKLEAKIAQRIQKYCLWGMKCIIPAHTMTIQAYMAEEQTPGRVFYAIEGLKMYGENAQGFSIFFKAVTFRSSESLPGEKFFCDLKRIDQITEREFNQLLNPEF